MSDDDVAAEGNPAFRGGSAFLAYIADQREAFVDSDFAIDAADRCGGSATSADAWREFELRAAACPGTVPQAQMPFEVPSSVVAVANGMSRCMAARFSPCGTRLAVGHQATGAAVYDATHIDSTPAAVLGSAPTVVDSSSDMGWSLLDLAWHRSSRYLVRCGWSSAIAVLREDAESVHIDAGGLHPQPFCIFGLDTIHANSVVAATNVGMVFVADIETHSILWKADAGNMHVADVNAACAFDYNTFLTGGDDGIVAVVDIRQGVHPAVCLGHTHGVTSISCRGDNRHFVTNSKDQTAKIYDIRAAHKEQAKISAGIANTASCLQEWDYRSPPADDEYDFGNTVDDNSMLTLKDHMTLFTLIRARFSPYDSTGGRFLAVGGVRGRVVVYDVVAGTHELLDLAPFDSVVRDVTWHPTSDFIAAACVDGRVRVLGPKRLGLPVRQ